jgi:hypothetical protein
MPSAATNVRFGGNVDINWSLSANDPWRASLTSGTPSASARSLRRALFVLFSATEPAHLDGTLPSRGYQRGSPKRLASALGLIQNPGPEARAFPQPRRSQGFVLGCFLVTGSCRQHRPRYRFRTSGWLDAPPTVGQLPSRGARPR